IFLLGARRLGAGPGRCLVLEDSPNGIRAAHRAGMIPVMIPDLVLPDKEIRALARAVLDSLSEVPSFIR
ncbi:HAD family phosphatase, partial [Klebsiella oxytoca]